MNPRPSPTAWHEAGHAVAAVLLLVPFHEVRLALDEDTGSDGAVLFRASIPPAGAWPSVSDGEAAAHRELTVLHAGLIVERQAAGIRDWPFAWSVWGLHGSGRDREQSGVVLEGLAKAGRPARESERFALAWDLLLRVRPLVRDVAMELHRRRSLSWGDVEEIAARHRQIVRDARLCSPLSAGLEGAP